MAEKSPTDQIRNFILFSKRDAEKFYIPSDLWDEFLDLAKKRKWKPKGTRKPFDKIWWKRKEPWPGWYTPAFSQLVTGIDAQAFASALKKAAKGKAKNHERRILRLAVFCKKGAFFIYPN